MKKITFPRNLITRDKSLDFSFSDDGSYFRGYKYKNILPITYCRCDDEVYCSIRLHYIMPFKDYCSDTTFNASIICDEFNGISVNDFDMDKFIANCEAVLNYYNNYNSPMIKKARISAKIEALSRQINDLKDQQVKLYQELEAVV